MNRKQAVFSVIIVLCSLMVACQDSRETAKTSSTPLSQGNSTGSGAVANTDAAKWAPAVEPKPLSQDTLRGLAWLVAHQLPSGAWGQGEESQHMGGGEGMKDKPSVADTCVAALALIRSGSTPSEGDYAKSILAAVNFVCSEVEQADNDTLYITETRGTRVQSKLGPYIDTFLASMLLAEAKDRMPDEASSQRVSACLHHIVAKIETNQRENGTWNNEGWAPTLSQSMAVKGLNRAAQAGIPVDQAVRTKAGEHARSNFDAETGSFDGSGSAGVDLYASASSYSAQADSGNTDAVRKRELEAKLLEPVSSDDRDRINAELEEIEQSGQTLGLAAEAITSRLNDERFIAGFGSNGGEEFLSYMSIGEGLVVNGGDEWLKWDASITSNLNRIQNSDGSWTGHHCITGRTFCTSAALLVLMTDRAPVPLAAIGSR